ncbi:hypothetical protein GW17_00035405 [Ensete ventricosum]|nr:hypothetical protein GW17_00035405 [Ensete ventricosum]
MPVVTRTWLPLKYKLPCGAHRDVCTRPNGVGLFGAGMAATAFGSDVAHPSALQANICRIAVALSCVYLLLCVVSRILIGVLMLETEKLTAVFFIELNSEQFECSIQFLGVFGRDVTEKKRKDSKRRQRSKAIIIMFVCSTNKCFGTYR